MPSLPRWLLSWLLNEVAGCGGAGIEPPNFDFCYCYYCWRLAVSCPTLPRFTLEDVDSCSGASISGASNGGATFLCQIRLDFEFDLGLTGSFFLTCSSSLCSVSSRSWRHLHHWSMMAPCDKG